MEVFEKERSVRDFELSELTNIIYNGEEGTKEHRKYIDLYTLPEEIYPV